MAERGAKGVGIDAVSMGGNDPIKANPGHQTLLGAGKFLVEALYSLDDVFDGRPRLFCAAPVKLGGCSGAWTRAMPDTGRLEQVGGVMPVALGGGRAAGVDAYEIATGSGARFISIAGPRSRCRGDGS